MDPDEADRSTRLGTGKSIESKSPAPEVDPEGQELSIPGEEAVDTAKSWGTLSRRPASKEQIIEAIKQASQDTPRYLFRTWHLGSGGDQQLNTLTHITPHAFKHREGLSRIFALDAQQLFTLILGHLLGEHIQSPFSSWTASLAVALGIANENPGSYVAILDTAKLSAANNVYWCGAQSFTDIGWGTYSDQYHIFGVVRGPTYQALPFVCFAVFMGEVSSMIASSTDEGSTAAGTTMPNPTLLEEAIRIGKLFRDPLSSVMAVSLMSLQAPIDVQPEVLNKLLRKFSFSSDLLDPLAVSVIESKHPGEETLSLHISDKSKGWTETLTATAGMQALIERQNRQSSTLRQESMH